MEIVEVRKFLALIFVKVANLVGIKDPVSEINKQDIREMILTKFKSLSVQEIDYAFKLDRYSGEPVQHYQLFNAEYVAKVLKKYQDWLLKKRQENNLNLSKIPEVVEPTPEERKEIRKQFLSNVFNDVKNTGYCTDGWLLYDDLLEQEKILVGDSVKKQMYDEQLKKYTEELKANGYQRSVKNEIEKLKRGDKKTVIVNRCKNILVAQFIKDFDGNYDLFYKEIEV